MQYILRIAIALALALVFSPAAWPISIEDVPNVHVADRSRYVSDPSGILSPQTRDALDAKLGALWRATSAEVVVVTVDRIDGDLTPEEFATALFEKWGIGKRDKDNGLLILVSRDDRAAQIRTGYGVEGIIPDITAGRILRGEMFPRFREGDYDGGVTAAVDAVDALLRNPEAAAEVASKYANDSRRADEDGLGEDLFKIYFAVVGTVALIMLVLVLHTIRSTRLQPDRERYDSLRSLWLPAVIVAFASLGLGLIPWLVIVLKCRSLRRHKRKCPNCGHRMRLIDEVHDNDYLTPAQDMEEKLDSVDYDVWNCPQCHHTDIIPYVNPSSPYKECPRCHTRAYRLLERRILRPSTERREGEGVNIYQCRACNYHDEKHFRLPKKPNTDALAAAAIGASVFGGRGGGGGGFSGGSFGGGHTGGGGAGGSW